MITRYTHHPLAEHNTFGIEASARLFVEYESVADLQQLLAEQDDLPHPFLAIGGGSNLLFLRDFPGTIFHAAIRGMEVTDETETEVILRVGAAEVWDDVVAFCVEHGWGGAENLSLIPGEAGASAVQNIGAYGAEAKDLIVRVETVEIATGHVRCFDRAECDFAYRHSIFKGELKGRYLVTHVTYRLSKQPVFNLAYGNIRAELEKYPEINLRTIRQAIIAIREAKLPDPKVEGNAGSFFMNPIVERNRYEALLQRYPDMPHYDVDEAHVKIPAAWMIDRCGWKGRTMGRAGVHDRQALVLVNRGGATGEEVVRLSEAIQASVRERFGIAIHPEVNFI